MANCNCNCNSNCTNNGNNCTNNCANNCSPVQANGCYSTQCGGYSTPNCSCIPCDTPVIVQPGPDLTNQTLVPVLADVIQNCMTINKYEPAFPGNLLFLTNFPTETSTGEALPAPSGIVCITGISYNYDCVGVEIPDDGDTITGTIDGRTFTLTATQASCSCRPAGSTDPATPLYNQFAGSVRTNACCCNTTTPPTSQQYAVSKIVEASIPFSVCNLNITIYGTIGGCPFTGTLVGTVTEPAAGGGTTPPAGSVTFVELDNPLPLDTLGFPETINFLGRMCLPTCTRVNINQQLDNCLTVDCIRPISATYTPVVFTGGTTPPTGNYLVVAGDLSLIINKQIYATTTEKLAVLTPVGTEVVCNNGTTTPACPQTASSCNGSCPPPDPAVPLPEA